MSARQSVLDPESGRGTRLQRLALGSARLPFGVANPVDAEQPAAADQFEGWPLTIDQAQNCGRPYRPKVFRSWGLYTVRIGEPDTDTWRVLTGLGTETADAESTLRISF